MQRIHQTGRNMEIKQPVFLSYVSALFQQLEHQNELQLYEDLFKHIWKVDYCGDVRTVMVHVSNLRKKLKEHNVDYIHTVRGVGYILSINE